MRFIIYGAGGVGGTIGARLHLQSYPVVFVARGEHGRALQRQGLHYFAPDGARTLDIPTVLHPSEIDFTPQDVVLLTMKSQHTAMALEDLLGADPGDVAVVCGQNGVANERMALRRFARVYAMVVVLPGLHLRPGEVVSYGAGRSGILDTGRFPDGIDILAEEICRALEVSGFVARPDPQVMRKKYAKLIMNLRNVLEAATDRGDVRQIGRELKLEAEACYSAAGIAWAHRRELADSDPGGYRFAEVPGQSAYGGSTWQSVNRRTGNLETEYLNGEIVQIGRIHGVPTPANTVCQMIGRLLSRGRLGEGHFNVAEINAMIDAARGAGVDQSGWNTAKQ